MDRKDLASLAPDILKLTPEEAAARIGALALDQQVELVLSLPGGRQRMDLVLLASKPEELVPALPPEDLVLTIKDIGDQDAVPLVDLSSNPQLTYLLDLELWIQEGLDLNHLTHWLNILLECGDQRVLRWLHSVDFEMLVLMLERTAVKIDRDDLENLPDLLGSRLYTPDDTHFLLIKVGADFSLMKQLLDLIYSYEREMFFALMANLGTTPLAEVEELALKWRNGRLADRGWPDLNEAVELYQPADETGLPEALELPFGLDNPPRYPLEPRFTGRLLGEGINHLKDQESRIRVASQLANLINRVLIADGMIPGEQESLVRSAERVKGRLEIGLSRLGARDARSSADLLEKFPLLHVFRLAQGEIHKRTRRAQQLRSTQLAGLFKLLPEPLPERLTALTASRPMFVPGISVLPAEFSDPSELAILDRDLQLAEAIAAACQALEISRAALPDPFPPGSHPEALEGLNLEALLLTVFCRSQVGLDPRPLPLPAERLFDLFGSLPGEPGRLQESIASWMAGMLGSGFEGTNCLVEDLTRLLTDQILVHRPQRIDPRFVEGLWIRIADKPR